MSESPIAFGLLLGCFGAGAVLGAFVLQPARARWSTETVASAGVAILGVATIVVGILRQLPALSVVMLIGGAAWIIFISLVTALGAETCPRLGARSCSGGVHISVSRRNGSGKRGVGRSRPTCRRSDRTDVGRPRSDRDNRTRIGLEAAGHNDGCDAMEPLAHAGRSRTIYELGLESGPVLVTVEYLVDREHASDFLKAMHRYERIRRRDGASRWGIYRDTERPDLYRGDFHCALVGGASSPA